MDNIFLINDKLFFDPDEHSLWPLNGHPGSKVVLHTPASDCLLLLLRHNHQVVTQKFLFEQVWEKQGAVVTTNALYQSITLLRKGLQSAGLSENILKTVPKVGYKLTAVVREGRLSDLIEPVVVLPVAVEAEEGEKPSHDVEPKAEPKNKSLLQNFSAYWVYFLAGLIFIFVCGVLYKQMAKNNSLFSDYHYIGQVNDCSLYSSQPSAEKSTHTFLMLDKHYPLSCKNGGVAYITLASTQQGSSLLLCSENIQSNNAQCQSYIFRKERYEN
jgi:DNA-binding winged helix-turn-helix (wHTH) protein